MTSPSILRVDPTLGTRVHIVGHRQGRPNLSAAGMNSSSCPFCVGGLEAPDPYEVKSFVNRWPAMGEDRCEVVLYSPDHEASLRTLGPNGIIKVIDLWTERTAFNAARDDVVSVLIFENRGAEVGATISHPHGQIYSYPHIPDRPLRRLQGGWTPDLAAGPRSVISGNFWEVWIPEAPVFPCEIAVAPREQHRSLMDLTAAERTELADVLADVLSRIDLHFGDGSDSTNTPYSSTAYASTPYMMWLNQQPFSTAPEDHALIEAAWFNIEIVSPWRAPGVQRYIAAAEVACQEYFNPVIPEELAASLRSMTTS